MEVKKEKIKAMFNSLDLDKLFTQTKHCATCGRSISDEEFEAGEGACFKCWEK